MIGIFSTLDFDTKSERMKKLIKPYSKIICFSASDMEWQLNNPYEFNINGRYFNEQYQPFYDFGIDKSDFYIVHPNDTKEFVNLKFRQADIVVFLGGQMENLETILRKFNLWDNMIYYKSKKNFIGTSAGALIMLEEYDITPYIDDFYTEYKKVKGLGLVKSLRILVHFDEHNVNHIKNLIYIVDDIIRDKWNNGKDIDFFTLKDGEYILKSN